ncbi:hypothetical protein NL676_021497 [Syzygium grande]|nr:hypothetical protein NL676_021497 [Syzygium grande]
MTGKRQTAGLKGGGVRISHGEIVDPEKLDKEPPVVPPMEPLAVQPLQAIPPEYESEDLEGGRVEDGP